MGLPGAGKSSVGPILAARLGRAFDDLDALVARREGRGVTEILRGEGESAFRAIERDALRGALLTGRREPPRPSPSQAPTVQPSPTLLVLACGGGVVTDPESRELLASRATVVWLTVRVETALERLGPAGVAERPLLADPERAAAAGTPIPIPIPMPKGPLTRLQALESSRNPLYESIAALTVATDGRSPDEVAADVASALRDRWDSSAS